MRIQKHRILKKLLGVKNINQTYLSKNVPMNLDIETYFMALL
tara:strand:- start:420 stop:545 length:126 start_codon:yes stop_codon:yes gene_type:complete